MNRSNTFISLGISFALIAGAIWLLYSMGFGAWFSHTGSWPMGWGGHGGMMGYGYGGGMMGYGYGRGPGFGGFGNGMGIVSLLFWGAAILAVVFIAAGAVSRSRHTAGSLSGHSGDALEILKRRYARGEINKAEFEARRTDLGA